MVNNIHNSLSSGIFPDNWKKIKYFSSPQKRKQGINTKLLHRAITAN